MSETPLNISGSTSYQTPSREYESSLDDTGSLLSGSQGQDLGTFRLPSLTRPLTATTPSTDGKDFRHHHSGSHLDMKKRGQSSLLSQKARNSKLKMLTDSKLEIKDIDGSPQTCTRDIPTGTYSNSSLGVEKALPSLNISSDRQIISNVSDMASGDLTEDSKAQGRQHSSSDSDVSMPDMAEVMQRFGFDDFWAQSMVRRMEKAEKRSSDGSTSQGN